MRNNTELELVAAAAIFANIYANILQNICLRSRPIYLNVVSQSVSLPCFKKRYNGSVKRTNTNVLTLMY